MSYKIKPSYCIDDTDIISKLSSENKISWNEACNIYSHFQPRDGEGSRKFYKESLDDLEYEDYPEIEIVIRKYFESNNIETLIVIAS